MILDLCAGSGMLPLLLAEALSFEHLAKFGEVLR